MKKSEQKLINERCAIAYETATSEQWNARAIKQLRTCKAWVFETDEFYILQSYQTVVAVIDKCTDTLYDCLRTVYGYTATSAQHIAKFNKDYGAGAWGCQERLTAR